MFDNFKQALKEIFLPEKSGTKNEQNNSSDRSKHHISEVQAPTIKSLEDAVEQKVQDGSTVQAVQKQPDPKKTTLFKNTYNNSKGYQAPPVIQKNIITSDTKILGTIITESNIEISGTVEGDVESKGNILVNGKVVGKITGTSAEINNAVVEGDIKIADNLLVKSDSKINGMLSAKIIDISGKVKGDVFGTSTVKIYSDAYVIGNITTPSIAVESGAVLQGKVDVQREDMEADF